MENAIVIRPTEMKRYIDSLEAFSQYLLIELGLGENTIYNIKKIVCRFLRQVDTEYPNRSQANEYVVAIRSSEYSYAHIVNTLRAVRRYMAFIGVDMKIGMPRKPKPRIKTTLTEAEVAVIIAASKNIREKAIISLLAYSGIRNEELCNLCLRDIKLGRNMIHIRNGKGSKDRVIPVHGECIKIILQYLAKHPREDDDRLFLTHDKKRKLKPWALRLMVKTVAKRAGIKRRIYPHLFRHSMATSMLHRGANPLTIQAQLGHSFIETTMIYVHSSQERLRAEYLTCAPSYT